MKSQLSFIKGIELSLFGFLNRPVLMSAAFIIICCLVNSHVCVAQQTERSVSTTSFEFKVEKVPLKVNYFSSPDVSERNQKITQLVIVVHDVTRNPFVYHNNMRLAAEKAGASENTLIIAPGFINEVDLNKNKDILTQSHIFWTNNGWKEGDPSVMNSDSNRRSAKLSSFEVMDSIIWKILNSGNFPGIRKIVIAGHSAGAQYVNRYSGSALIHDQVRNKFGIDIKYLVSAPGTYTYLTPERPMIGSPGKFFTPPDSSCNGLYDVYRYGSKNFNEYLARTGPEKFKAQFALREVAYFVGSIDNDPRAADLDRTCPAILQGMERKQRAEYFIQYLHHLFGKWWKLTIVPEVGHDHARIFSSEEALQWLFR